jgi:hypothetical protein
MGEITRYRSEREKLAKPEKKPQLSQEQIECLQTDKVDFSGTLAQWQRRTVRAQSLWERLRAQQKLLQQEKSKLHKKRMWMLFPLIGFALLGLLVHSAWLIVPCLFPTAGIVWYTRKIDLLGTNDSSLPRTAKSRANFRILLPFFRALKQELDPKTTIRLRLLNRSGSFTNKTRHEQPTKQKFPRYSITEGTATWFEGSFDLQHNIHISFAVEDQRTIHLSEFKPEVRSKTKPAHYKTKTNRKGRTRRVYRPAKTTKKTIYPRKTKYRYCRTVTATIEAPIKKFRAAQLAKPSRSVTIAEKGSKWVIRVKFQQRGRVEDLDFDVWRFLSQLRSGCERLIPQNATFRAS